jgi:tRNA-splicing endonuclease subunit Sen54
MDTLAEKREYMHAALSEPRFHRKDDHCVAVYHAKSNMAWTYRPRGKWCGDMGRQKGDIMWLLPEEALYLLESARVDVRYPEKEDPLNDMEPLHDPYRKEQGKYTKEDPMIYDGKEEKSENILQDEMNTMRDYSDYGTPMSLQAAYALFIGRDANLGGTLTMEKYIVYSSLRRAGWSVMRAELYPDKPALKTDTSPINQWNWLNGSISQDVGGLTNSYRTLLNWLFQKAVSPSQKQLAHGPLVKPGYYRSYGNSKLLVNYT